MDEYKCLNKFKKPIVKKKKSFLKLVNICLFTILIFLINLILCKSNDEYKEFIHKYVYTNNISFSKIENIFNKYLGDVIPTLSNTSQEVFNEKLVYNSIEEVNDGAKINVKDKESINSFESGIVVFSGIKDNLGNTVIIEQIDGNEAWYVNIDNSNIKIYDYIEKGSIIGNVLTDNFTIYFKNKGEAIDYKKYIS